MAGKFCMSDFSERHSDDRPSADYVGVKMRPRLRIRGGLLFPAIAIFVLTVANSLAAQEGWTYSVVHNFQCTGDGETPKSTMLYWQNNLYGTAQQGGMGSGTVFKVSPNDVNTSENASVYEFGSKPPNDGETPRGFLAFSSSALYGLTSVGGTNEGGTIFKLNPGSKKETILFNFSNTSENQPYAGLSASQTVANTVYGTTTGGGSLVGGVQKGGTVFSETIGGGTPKVLYKFCSVLSNGECTDGQNPRSGVIQDSDGYLYGTTFNGGIGDNGTVFKLDPGAGKLVWSLPLKGGSSGSGPQGGLTFAGDYLYGTTMNGGAGYGTVFAINLASHAKIAVVWTFKGSSFNDGATPMSEMLAVTTQTPGVFYLYGTTSSGGDQFGDGTVFRLLVKGSQSYKNNRTVFWQIPWGGIFPGGEGKTPYGGLTQINGVLYGTMSQGGSAAGNCGTVFKLSPPPE